MMMRVLAETLRREMSIRAALEWAFGAECAHLDFAESQGDNARPGVSTIWQIMMRGQLGCSIDGGGHSQPAADADIIASAVAALPVALGGKPMADRIATLARTGMVPDWMRDAAPRCVPVAWGHENQHGQYAVTEKVGTYDEVKRGRKVTRDILCCPVKIVPTAAQIARARREYLDWWGALLHLQSELRSLKVLDRIVISREMPPMTPWRIGAAHKAA